MRRPTRRRHPRSSISTVRKHQGSFEDYLRRYRYLPELTRRLDALGRRPLTLTRAYEIVLWKVSRYAKLRGMLKDLDGVLELGPGEHRKARAVLMRLLRCDGIDLPLASTILRFRNPSVFQIIDRRAYRAWYGKTYDLQRLEDNEKANHYFSYLSDLQRFCRLRDIGFVDADRVLYQWDKEKNGNLRTQAA